MTTPSVEHLPDDILREIYAFLPAEKQITINRKSYDSHIEKVAHRMRKKQCYHRYLKHLIRGKKNKQFARYLDIDCSRWFRKKNWREEGMRHSSYLHFLAFFAYRHQSMECYRLIQNHQYFIEQTRFQTAFSNY
jgi:hypothetical protein